MGIKLIYMGLKVIYMGLKLSYIGLNMSYMGLEFRECKIPINFQLRNSVLNGFQTSKPELITEFRFYL